MMGPDDTAFALEVAVAVLIVAIVTAASGACAAVHDSERALGTATLMTYAQAAMKSGKAEERCAICLSEYAAAGGDDDLVRVVPACGHFFHAGCDVDRWLRTRRTCPICRGGLWPLPRRRGRSARPCRRARPGSESTSCFRCREIL
jgi:hypothetical protein